MKQDELYLSTFIPLIERAETQIKKLVYFYATNHKPKRELKLKIIGVIEEVDKTMPKNVINRQDYIDGLKLFANNEIKKTYEPIEKYFLTMLLLLSLLGLKQVKTLEELKKYIANPSIQTQLKMGLKSVINEPIKDFINRPTDNVATALKELEKTGIKPKRLSDIDLWGKAKGTPHIPNYDKEVEKRINEMVENNVSSPSGISLWQKAEIDLRQEHQKKMIEEVKAKYRYAYISSHPDCSKRCEPWQGKLMDLYAPKSELSNFRMKNKVDGKTCYCFNEIIHQKQKTKKGKVYENNVIVGFNCFDKETEVLTNNGWKRFQDLKEEDLIYTLNTKNRMSEWQKPIHYYKSLYKGEMIHFKSYTSDLMTTPNHNFIYFTQYDKTLRFKKAEEIGHFDYQYSGQEWTGKEQEIIIGDKKVNAPLFCRLLGYYLADGSIHDGTSITIARQHNDLMWERLQNLPFKLWRDDNRIIVRDKALKDLFATLGRCDTKYIFPWVKDLNKECLNELLEAFVFKERKPHKTIFTTSNQMCADLCEVALKCGYRPKIELVKQKGKEQTFNFDLYKIHLNYNVNFTYKSIERVIYNDFIYCVEVPNHTLLVKRNGFIQWCGNCRHKLIPYTGQLPPEDYNEEDVEKERKINDKLRAMERRIRKLKQQYKITGNKTFLQKAKKLYNEYVKLAEKYGFPHLKWRTEI